MSNIHMSNIQCHKVNIPFPRGRNRGIERRDGPEKGWNPVGQTSPIVPHPASGAHGSKLWSPEVLRRPTILALLVQHTCPFLGWLFPQPATFLCRCSMLLASLNLGAWGVPYCSFGYLYTALHIALSGVSCRDSDADTVCLASQAFLWNVGGSLCDLLTLAFCFPPWTNSTRTKHAWSVTILSSSWSPLNQGCIGLCALVAEHNEHCLNRVPLRSLKWVFSSVSLSLPWV